MGICVISSSVLAKESKMIIFRARNIISMKKRMLFIGFLMITVIPLWSQTDSLKRFGFTISGGFTYFTENNDDEISNIVSVGGDEHTLRKYYNDLASGYHLDIKAAFQLNRFWAIGLQYRYSGSSGESWLSLDPQDGIHLYYGKLSQKVSVNYAGLGLYATDILHFQKLKLQAGLSGGLSYLRIEEVQLWTPCLTKGKHFMFGPSVGVEFPLTGRLSLVAEGSWYFARLKKVKFSTENDTQTITYDEKKYYEDISSISLSAGIKISL
jgi:hypothetical protein